MNVKLSHAEVIHACQEWLLKHHGLEFSMKHPPLVIQTQSGGPASMQICLEFPGIEPKAKPETPYRG